MNRRLVAYVSVLLAACLIGYYFLSRTDSPVPSANSSPHPATNSIVTTTRDAGVSEIAQRPNDAIAVAASGNRVAQPSAPATAFREASLAPDMLEVLFSAQKTSDSTLREIALFVSRGLCSIDLLNATDGKFSPLVESKRELLDLVTRQLRPSALDSVQKIAERCNNAMAESDDYAKTLRGELRIERGPISTALAATESLNSFEQLETARTALISLLQSNNSKGAAFVLKRRIAFGAQPWIVGVLPPELRADSLEIGVIATEMALCQAGLDCGARTAPRASVCVKYGECGAVDVVAAYRHLHELYGIPFALTKSVADKLQHAIETADASTLMAKR